MDNFYFALRLKVWTIRKSSGMTLIEVLVGLALASTAMAGVASAIIAYLDDLKASSTASYQKALAIAAANYINKHHQDFDPDVPKSVSLSDLKNAGFAPPGMPATNAYGQTPCLLVKKIYGKNSDRDDIGSNADAGSILALLVTEGGRDIPKGELAYIAAQSGDGGGYIPPTLNATGVDIKALPVSSPLNSAFHRDAVSILDNSVPSYDSKNVTTTEVNDQTGNQVIVKTTTSDDGTVTTTKTEKNVTVDEAAGEKTVTITVKKKVNNTDETTTTNTEITTWTVDQSTGMVHGTIKTTTGTGDTSSQNFQYKYIEARGAYGTWRNSLRDFSQNKTKCSKNMTSSAHLATLVNWQGSRGVTDFLYRKWVPGNANADANKMSRNINMNKNNISNATVTSAQYITLTQKNQDGFPCTSQVEGTLSLDNINQGVLICHNGRWTYPAQARGVLRQGPSCISYADKNAELTIPVPRLEGWYFPTKTANGTYSALCKRFCPAGTYLATVVGGCQSGGMDDSNGSLDPYLSSPLTHFDELEYIQELGRQGVKAKCDAEKSSGGSVTPKLLSLQLYCRDYTKSIDSIVSSYNPNDSIYDRSAGIYNQYSDIFSINEENGGCWLANPALYGQLGPSGFRWSYWADMHCMPEYNLLPLLAYYKLGDGGSD